MKEYALTVFIICVISGVLEKISFGGRKDISKIALSVITLYVVISPLVSAVGNIDFDALLDSEGIYDGEAGGGCSDVAKISFARGIERAVEDKFYLDRGTVNVSVEGFSFEEMRAENIKVTLLKGALWVDYQAVEKYVNSMEIGECEVDVEIG